MRTLFAVTRTKGKRWNETKSMRSQLEWTEHAAFMYKLSSDGFVVLGGPLGESGDDILLAIKADNEDHVRLVLEQDPWTKSGILDLKSIQPWTILLESTKR
jgi:uncharacterized protein YciI